MDVKHLNAISDGTPQAPSAAKRPILVPVDFSSCSRNALLFASQFAASLDAPILVLHVVHDQNRKPGLYSNNRKRGAMRPIDDVAADMLAEFIEDVSRHGDAAEFLRSLTTRLVGGLPAQRIVEIARREDAALIVMGSHGRVGLSRLASGSVAAEVVVRSPIPVTVVKALPSGKEDPGLLGSAEWWQRHRESKTTESSQDMAAC